MKHAMEKLKPAEMIAVTAKHVAAAQKQVQGTIVRLQAFQAETLDAEAKRDIAERSILDKLKADIESLRSKLYLTEEEEPKAQNHQQQQQSSSSFSQENPSTGPSNHAHMTTQQQRQTPLLSSSTGRRTPQLTQGGDTLISSAADPAQMTLPQPPLTSSPTAHTHLPPSTPFPRTPLPLVRSSNLPLSNPKPMAAISVSSPKKVRQIAECSSHPAEEEILQNDNFILATLQERVNALQLQTQTFVKESLQALNTTQSNGSFSVQEHLAENTNLVNWYRTHSELQDERISQLLRQATKSSAGIAAAEQPFPSPKSMLSKHHLRTEESPISYSLDSSSLSMMSLPIDHRITLDHGHGYQTGYWRSRYHN